jgi:hypothetical protein
MWKTEETLALVLKKRIRDFSQTADSKTKNFREFQNVFRNVAETTGDNREEITEKK